MHQRLARAAMAAAADSARYPAVITFLWSALAIYLALPLVEVPLFGLSLSAPFVFLLAAQAFLKPPQPWLKEHAGWVGLALAIWLGIFTSTAVNSFASGGAILERGVVTSLVQYAYWMVVFVLSAHLVPALNIGRRTAWILAAGTVGLALLRLGEAAFGGAIGYWSRLVVMSQNGYGIQFSMFSALVLALAFGSRKTLWPVLGALAVWAAIFINGSRSSWIATTIAAGVFLALNALTFRRMGRGLAVLLLLGVAAMVGFQLAPAPVRAAFDERFVTFENLDEDKSYAVRQMMIQKGITLFEEDPLFGVGTSRWTKEVVALELPTVLRFRDPTIYDRKSSHNSYIGFLAENGLVGSIPLGVLILFLAVRGGLAALRLARRGETWALGIYAGFIGMSIHLWTLSGLSGTVTWFVYGLVAALIRMDTMPEVERRQA